MFCAMRCVVDSVSHQVIIVVVIIRETENAANDFDKVKYKDMCPRFEKEMCENSVKGCAGNSKEHAASFVNQPFVFVVG